MSESQSPRRASRKKAPSLAPLYGGIGIVILAIIAVAISQKDKDARDAAKNREQPVQESSNPFADIPAGTKVVPSPFESGSSASHSPSATGLLASAVWVEAKAKAELAKTTLQEAKAADEAGDRKKYKRMAVEARDLYSAAIDSTAQWEYDISESHGESDSQVSTVRSLRATWFDQHRKLRSVDVNDI
ncbi:MAG: hypothetical protein P1V35_04785 [Planctomycetota bacterium]|nr:hypothetical protein [Planctomycetota bacterium]